VLGRDGHARAFRSPEEHVLRHAAAIGVQIDPDTLVKQYRSGVPEHVILRRPDGAPMSIPAEHDV